VATRGSSLTPWQTRTGVRLLADRVSAAAGPAAGRPTRPVVVDLRLGLPTRLGDMRTVPLSCGLTGSTSAGPDPASSSGGSSPRRGSGGALWTWTCAPAPGAVASSSASCCRPGRSPPPCNGPARRTWEMRPGRPGRPLRPAGMACGRRCTPPSVWCAVHGSRPQRGVYLVCGSSCARPVALLPQRVAEHQPPFPGAGGSGAATPVGADRLGAGRAADLHRRGPGGGGAPTAGHWAAL